VLVRGVNAGSAASGSQCINWSIYGTITRLKGQEGCCRSRGFMSSTVNIMWKVINCRGTVVLQLEWCGLQWTLSGRYFTAGGQWYCSLNGVCYSEHYLEDTSQLVDSSIAAWNECVTVNIIWKIIHSWWTVVFQLEWSVLQWTLSGRYFTAGGQ
jgi:hypothetical protein